MEENNAAPNLNQEPVKPIPIPHKNSKLPLFLILIFLFTLLIGVGGFYLGRKSNKETESMPTVAPTSVPIDKTLNSKTYTSNDGNYSFQYPDSSYCTVHEYIHSSGETDKDISVDCDKGYDQKVNNTFAVIHASGITDLNKYLTENKKALELAGDEYRWIKFHGQDALEVARSGSLKGGAAGSSHEIYTIYKGKVYLIQELFLGLYDLKKINDFPKSVPNILSTLTFSSDTSSNTNWATQKLGIYPVTVDLPPDWKLQEVNRHPEPSGPGDPKTGHDCADYKIVSDDNQTIIELKPICGYSDGGGMGVPKDAVIIWEQENKYIFRTYEAVNSLYTYATGGYVDISDTKSPRISKGKMYTGGLSVGDNLNFVYMSATMKYLGDQSNIESILKTTDEIISSLKKI